MRSHRPAGKVLAMDTNDEWEQELAELAEWGHAKVRQLLRLALAMWIADIHRMQREVDR
jgi:hypothetical protein